MTGYHSGDNIETLIPMPKSYLAKTVKYVQVYELYSGILLHVHVTFKLLICNSSRTLVILPNYIMI